MAASASASEGTVSASERTGAPAKQFTARQVLDYVAYMKRLDGPVGPLIEKTEGDESGWTDPVLLNEVCELQHAIHQGICSQMKWNALCESGQATFSVTGVCDYPAIMEHFLNLKPSKIQTLKTKNFTPVQFEDAIIRGFVREDTPRGRLYLTNLVKLMWDYDSGEYSFIGKYGIFGSGDMIA